MLMTMQDSMGALWKKFSFLSASRFFLAVFLIFFPFQIRTLIYSAPVFSSGGFDEYTSFFISLSDIFLLLAFLSWGFSYLRKERDWNFNFGEQTLTLFLLGFLAFMTVDVVFAQDKFLHLLTMFRFIELFLFYLMLVNDVLTPRQVIIFFLLGMSFQAITAVFQYMVQGSLGLTILGEPSASIQTLGVAKIDIGSQKILRSFGTFPQANVLGGALFMAFLLSVMQVRKKLFFFLPFILLIGAGLVFSFSRSAFFALIVSFLVYISVNNNRVAIRYVLLLLTFLLFFIVIFHLEGIFFQRFLFDDLASTQERTLYLQISRDMLLSKPLGVGFGGFTFLMQGFTTTKLTPWLFQPVHNVFLLIANELGIVAGILFFGMFGYLFWDLLRFYRSAKTSHERHQGALWVAMLLGLVTIFLFDHYFFSLFPGQVLLFLYLGLVSNFASKARLPRRNS